MKYYKVLGADGRCVNGGVGRWYLPTKRANGTWKPGKWMPAIEGVLIPCENGYHLCRPLDLPHWLDEAIFEVEYRGEMVKTVDKVVVRKARLLRKLEAWDERTARLFACDCAERVLMIFEKEYPNDDRPREAVEVSRRYADGEATEDELAAACSAAEDTAEATASATAWAASSAAWATARSAAEATASATAWATAWAAEREWQMRRLIEILGEGQEVEK